MDFELHFYKGIMMLISITGRSSCPVTTLFFKTKNASISPATKQIIRRILTVYSVTVLFIVSAVNVVGTIGITIKGSKTVPTVPSLMRKIIIS